MGAAKAGQRSRIVLDAMGGDRAPAATVAGAVLALGTNGLRPILVGDKQALINELKTLAVAPEAFEIVHASETVGMDEHPATAVREKRESSIRVAAALLKEGRADALLSMGNSGATLAVGVLVVGRLPGVDRPALGSLLPVAGGRVLVLDIGANSDCSPENLCQFAVMGSVYMQRMEGLPSPRVGLLNVGEEHDKGSKLYREAQELLPACGINFAGNVEGTAMFSGGFDVIVCDGFTGNIAIKLMEGVGEYAFGLLRTQVRSSWINMAGALLMRGALRGLRRQFDYSEWGGAPLLGLNGVVLIGHGRSDAKAVAAGLSAAQAAVEAGLVSRMAEGLAEHAARETV